MAVFVFARDMVAFPTAWFTGTDYNEAKDKARAFIYSTTRVVIACGIVWGLYKGQRCEALRKFSVPVALFTARVGRITFSLEPISLLINLYLIKTARSRWITGGYCAAVGIWQCVVQTMRQWTKEDPSLFSARIQKAVLNIDPLSHLMRIALWKTPETRLGISIFTTIYGILQLNAYTIERWNLRDAPTELALKGVVHLAFGLCWFAAYENYNSRLENTHAKEATYLYRAANWAAPYLAWLATGQRG
jgi:hypothetical protein